jgi:hypothetical protein
MVRGDDLVHVMILGSVVRYNCMGAVMHIWVMNIMVDIFVMSWNQVEIMWGCIMRGYYMDVMG